MRRIRTALLIPLFLGIALSRSSGNQGPAVFDAEGVLITEGRIFAVASSDFDRDGRPDLVAADYLDPARILYNDDAHTFGRVAPLPGGMETATSGHGVAVG